MNDFFLQIHVERPDEILQKEYKGSKLKGMSPQKQENEEQTLENWAEVWPLLRKENMFAQFSRWTLVLEMTCQD